MIRINLNVLEQIESIGEKIKSMWSRLRARESKLRTQESKSIERRAVNKLGEVLYYLILLFAALTFMFPVIYMLVNSLMDVGEVTVIYSALSGAEGSEYMSIRLIPQEVSFMQYYNVLLRKPKFLVMFWNSVIATLPVILGQMIVGSMAAFSFSKIRFPFRDQIFFVYIIVMMLPFQVTLVPNYLILRRLNLLDTYWAIILPGIFTTFGVFLLRQFMMLVPHEYSEASKIDGAGFLTTFARIVLPQCKSALASLAILSFIDNWNMVEQPLIFLKNANMHPMSVFLRDINYSELGLAFACGMLYMIPPVIIFFYGENHLVQGIQLSGIK